jgi:hypothetical protein
VGLPNLLSFGGGIKLTRYLGAGLDIGLIPTVRLSYYGDATLMYQKYDIYGRLYPFGGMFFLGAGVGYETVRGKLENQFSTSTYVPAGTPGVPESIAFVSEASVRTMVLTPQIGIFHTWGPGFSLGIDFGAQVPIAPSEIQFDTQVGYPAGVPDVAKQEFQRSYIDPNDERVKQSLEKVGRTIIPTVNIRMGWLL